MKQSKNLEISQVEIAPNSGANQQIVLGEDDPNSLYSKLPTRMKEIVSGFDEKDWFLSPRAAERLSKVRPEERLLKQRLWREYDRCVRTKKGKIAEVDLIQGLMCYKTFYDRFEANKFKIVWYLSPPENYENIRDDMLDIASSEMQKILDLPMFTEVTQGGETVVTNVDHRLMGHKIELFKYLSNSKYGSPVSRALMLQKTVNEESSSSQSELAQLLEAAGPEVMQKVLDVVTGESVGAKDGIIEVGATDCIDDK